MQITTTLPENTLKSKTFGTRKVKILSLAVRKIPWTTSYQYEREKKDFLYNSLSRDQTVSEIVC